MHTLIYCTYNSLASYLALLSSFPAHAFIFHFSFPLLEQPCDQLLFPNFGVGPGEEATRKPRAKGDLFLALWLSSACCSCNHKSVLYIVQVSMDNALQALYQSVLWWITLHEFIHTLVLLVAVCILALCLLSLWAAHRPKQWHLMGSRHSGSIHC